jgi:hypothetical protein
MNWQWRDGKPIPILERWSSGVIIWGLLWATGCLSRFDRSCLTHSSTQYPSVAAAGPFEAGPDACSAHRNNQA